MYLPLQAWAEGLSVDSEERQVVLLHALHEYDDGVPKRRSALDMAKSTEDSESLDKE